MDRREQIKSAERFAALHDRSNPLILTNAWDVASALVLEKAGSKAIGTTSAGVAFSFGCPDGEKLDREVLFSVVGRIVRALSVPVSVDLEAGYGASAEEIAKAVARELSFQSGAGSRKL